MWAIFPNVRPDDFEAFLRCKTRGNNANTRPPSCMVLDSDLTAQNFKKLEGLDFDRLEIDLSGKELAKIQASPDDIPGVSLPPEFASWDKLNRWCFKVACLGVKRTTKVLKIRSRFASGELAKTWQKDKCSRPPWQALKL
eukprot:GABV01001828.1.p2 GENE.GABV01001828.1~~GABV01001828.1.p2  ORF type:complete len:140 (+),score=30.74 GABV01001828.1:327-746(+)